MKELDSFTVERLGEIKNAFLDCHKETAPSIGEIFALIDIALAAKRDVPAYWITYYPNPDPDEFDDVAHSHSGAKSCAVKIAREIGGFVVPVYYGLPQLNSPEIPEGWKLVPIEPTLAMLTLLGLTGSFESMLERYANMLDAAPEKENG
ncbi:TPA: hypothetical protein ACQD72_001639 [Yersinia enterocolitica]